MAKKRKENIQRRPLLKPNTPSDLPKSALAIGGVCATVITLLVFFLFGYLGFSPTDEGSFMATARRLIEGYVPHRDFIYPRPPLSAILHAPVLLAGDYTLLLSRLVAGFQISITVWLGVSLLKEELAGQKSLAFYLAMFIIAYAITGALLIYWAWSTLDGVFLLTVGVFFVRKKNVYRQAFGYFLIGGACLTKQSFVLTIPMFWLLFGGWRDWRFIVISLLPGALYVLFLLVTDAFADAWLQMVSIAKGQSSNLAFGNFLAIPSIVGFTIAVMITYASRIHDDRWRIYAVILAAGLLLWITWLIKTAEWAYSQPAFGAAIGVLTARLFLDKIFLPYLAALLVIGWASSLSIGAPYPAWIGGVLGVSALMVAINGNPQKKLKKNRHDSFSTQAEWAVILTVLLAAIAVFIDLRLNNIYREKLPSFLIAPLDEKFPGAAGIVSSPTMASVYVDLQEMVGQAREDKKKYAIVPEFAAWWAAADEVNPLPMDWVLEVELGRNHPDLVKRLLTTADSIRPETYFIVQKFTAEAIPRDKPGVYKWQTDIGPENANKWENSRYILVGHIRENYELYKETEYFWLYK